MTIPKTLDPPWLKQVEEWLVGGALLSEQADVISAAAEVAPEDFRDPTLGKVWDVLPYLECPCAAHVARALAERGQLDEIGAEPRLVELAGSENARLYSARVCLEAHAVLVREYGERRRRLQELSAEAAAVYAGTNVVPFRPLYDRPEYQGLAGLV